MTEQNEAPKRKPGRPPWTEEQKQAHRERMAQKKAEAAAQEQADLEAYAAQKAQKKPYVRHWTEEEKQAYKEKMAQRREEKKAAIEAGDFERAAQIKANGTWSWSEGRKEKNQATWAKKRAKLDEERKALIAANPHKSLDELGIDPHWKPADGSDSGYYRMALRQARVGIDLPPININNPQDAAQRVEEYFDFCESADRPPNMIGLANWLGVTRGTLAKWKNGDFNDGDSRMVVQRAISIIEESLVNQVQANPKVMVGGMFLLKSMFHYKEQQDVVISTDAQNTRKLNAEEIAARYLDDGKSVETTFADEQNGQN